MNRVKYRISDAEILKQIFGMSKLFSLIFFQFLHGLHRNGIRYPDKKRLPFFLGYTQ